MMEAAARTVEGRGGFPKYPLRHLQVGEEYFFAGVAPNLVWKRACELKHMKFHIRQVKIKGIPGAFVVRVS